MAFNIIPVVNNTNHRKKRDITDEQAQNGFHGLFRRPIDLPIAKSQSTSFQTFSDYAEAPKGYFTF